MFSTIFAVLSSGTGATSRESSRKRLPRRSGWSYRSTWSRRSRCIFMFPIFGVSGPRTSDPQRTRRFMGTLSFKVDCCRRTIFSLACHSLAAIIVAVRRLQPAKFPSVLEVFGRCCCYLVAAACRVTGGRNASTDTCHEFWRAASRALFHSPRSGRGGI